MSAPTQLECGGRACSRCGKCRDWDPANDYKRRDDATCRDNADTLISALFCAATAAADARRVHRMAANVPRAHATDRCRRAADDLQAAFDAAILDDHLIDLIADVLSRAELIADDVDRASDDDGVKLARAASAVRRARCDRVCHCK
ncbi:unnamed protein product [Rotaria sp. Silwood2]|nr:unnamed protein product [Rotaria sp. Silwood2]CAF4552101.1 unnamed protein product [Rotaria sp. Silwood2]CAF4750056.1 unnamed protein product [Rotaria sp. Silwood2]